MVDAGRRRIGAASFFSDLGHEVPTALLPTLLTSTLGASASAPGLIKGVSDALSGVARLGGGALAEDPTRRLTVALGGYATTAVQAAGNLSASVVAGLIWSGVSPAAAFVFLAACMAAAIPLIVTTLSAK